ncbi:serine hydrolase domain-containing protein [Myxococcus landrumensis]|uniref:Serine hydrolase n=1 Tax=Myxococcus landrumensis TaxID=2813577 RepID=A0ABX7N134_9BACT|nr:serine hydrolase [Myxococcus landrumus]QSQ11410.1 serine hydrolase [Myxococcus landrumus]
MSTYRRHHRNGVARVVLSLLVAYLSLLMASPAFAAQPRDLPRAVSPEAEGIDPKALEKLLEEAKASHSSAVVILKNGKLIGEWTFGKPSTRIEAMSVTKSVVGMGVVKLLADGKIPSLDVPVHQYFPEWNQGRKKDITLRHLLNHTSGIDVGGPGTGEIYQSPDFVRLALAAELAHAPGTQLQYNNKAVNLLAAIVEKASGKRMDRYFGDAFFRPMGITDYSWTLDKAGNPHAMSGLQIQPRDLAKLGQLLVDGGMWHLRQLLPQEWVKRMLAPGEGPAVGTGLLWWPENAWHRYFVDEVLLSTWKQAGVPQPLIQAATALLGRDFQDRDTYLDALGVPLPEFQKEIMGRNQKPWRVETGPLVGAQANGWLGQYLVVLPEQRLVAVRMYDYPEDTKGEAPPADSFGTFILRVKELVHVGPPPVGEATQTQGSASPR